MDSIKVEKLFLNYEENISQDLVLNSLKSHSEIKCNFCQKEFSNMNDHIDHLKSHATEQPYICEYCEMRFFECIDLEQHIDMHNEYYTFSKRAFPCTMCPKSFKSNKFLSAHLIIHARKNTFTCEECNISFACRDSLANHLKLHNNQPIEELLSNYKPCISQASDSKSCPEKHLYVCNICQKEFSNMKDHIDHLKTHATETPFVCEYCKMAFSECVDLEKHIDIHTEHYPLSDKPFPCELCPKSFKSNCDLKKHLFTHTKVKPFSCEQCKICFVRKQSLNEHRKTHHSLSKIRKNNKTRTSRKKCKFL